MIPQHIRLKGFLCYKDEQEISFDHNATLWMLSGLNGSGKSSTFDAVTYALFGHHRGGGQQAEELINKDSDGLAIEFDFKLDKQLYRIRRTVKRTTRGATTSTQQIYRYKSNGEKNPWVAIEGTNYKKQFGEWINENIGLNYETFTSSVLLLQGKADKLLDSKAEGRRAVLASIVDLESYERLHAKADAQRKTLERECDGLKGKLALLPEVKPEQLVEAEERIRVSEEARDAARAEVERLRDLEHQAKAWGELRSRLQATRQRWEDAKRLLADSSDIERDVDRLRELRDVLPHLREIVDCRTKMCNAQTQLKSLANQREHTSDKLKERTIALDQERSKRDATQRMLESEEAQCRTARNELHGVKLQLDRLEQYERQESDLKQVRDQLARLPEAPDRDVGVARAECERLIEMERVVPLLTRLLRQREELRQAMQRESKAQRELEEITARGNKLKAECERLAPLAEVEKQALQQANERVTEARTEVKQARESLTQATQLEGAATCRHCGQPVLPGHIDEEKRKRRAALQQAETRERQEKEAQKNVQERELKLRTELTQAEKNRHEARFEFEQARGTWKQSTQEIERARSECALAFEELPQVERVKVRPTGTEDWLTTTYPTTADLDSLRSQIEQLPRARQREKQAEETKTNWMQQKAKEAANLDQLQRLRKELPADPQSVRAEHGRLDLNVRTREKTIDGHKTNLKTSAKEIERLTRDRQATEVQAQEIDKQFRKHELDRDYAQNALEKQTKSLPEVWKSQVEDAGITQVHLWETEKTDLETKGTEECGKRLQHARLNVDVLKQDAEALEKQQESFSVEARVDPAAIQERLVQARRTEKTRDDELTDTRQQKARLNDCRTQREKIANDMIRVEGEYSKQKTLTDLLGKDRLQLHLVRQAEKGVVEYANAVLDRLSGGQLYLKLRSEAEGEGSSAKALELEAYNRVTGEKPINVAFLSGSQKFRVAVGLALGIGQYASRQHRPIESVIIDEGFGCLDSQGRQVMIQELQNLRSQMRCILLVSHQEEFAEAFSDGYFFKLENGATTVARIQK